MVDPHDDDDSLWPFDEMQTTVLLIIVLALLAGSCDYACRMTFVQEPTKGTMKGTTTDGDNT